MTDYYRRPSKAISNTRDIAPGTRFWSLTSFEGAKPVVDKTACVAGQHIWNKNSKGWFLTYRYPGYKYARCLSLKDFNVLENKYNDHYLFLSYDDAIEAANMMSKPFLGRYSYDIQK